jgi:hypothetical protein
MNDDNVIDTLEQLSADEGYKIIARSPTQSKTQQNKFERKSLKKSA